MIPTGVAMRPTGACRRLAQTEAGRAAAATCLSSNLVGVEPVQFRWPSQDASAWVGPQAPLAPQQPLEKLPRELQSHPQELKELPRA